VKSPSPKEYADALFAGLMRCRHPQAEPVILSTGELVACVCIGCYQQLPAEYIDWQRDRSNLEAYCPHRDKVEVTGFNKADREFICRACGGWVSDSEWLAFRLG
jgi:hypothetical protein